MLVLSWFNCLYMQNQFKCQTHLSKRLKNAPEHVLSYIEVQGANIQPHGPCTTSLEHASHGCGPVLLSLKYANNSTKLFIIIVIVNRQWIFIVLML